MFRLDVVCTARFVENSGVGGIGIDCLDGELVTNELGECGKCVDTDTVCAIDI